MVESDDFVTIETAVGLAGISPSAIGYWIVTGQLQATATPSGRMVKLADVRRLSAEVNLPGVRRAPAASKSGDASDAESALDDSVDASQHGAALQPSVHDAVEGPRVMAEIAAAQRDPGSAPVSVDQLARFDERLLATEREVGSLRESVAQQQAQIEQLRSQLAGASRRDEGDQQVPDEQSSTSQSTIAEEPELTLRLRPAFEDQAAPFGPVTSRRTIPRELPRLTRDTEPATPITPPADPSPDTGTSA